MKKILVLILIGLLAACESSALIQEEGNGTVLVLTYVEGLEASFEGFFKRPFEVVRSLDGIVLSEYERIVVLYDDNLNRVFPPLMFGGSRLSYSQIVTFDHHEGVELTMVYLDGLDDYQEMFDLLDHRIYDIRTPQVVYELYPLQGISVNVTIDNVDRSLLLQSLPATAELAPSGDNLRWFYASEEVYLFVGENIPTYLSKYAEQLSELNEEAIVIVNERGQRLVIGRALGPFASEYYESFATFVAEGISSRVTLPSRPPVNISFPQPRVAPPEACYTRDLRAQIDVMMKDTTTTSHEIDKERIPSTGRVVGLVVMIGFDEIPPVASDEKYRSVIEMAKDSTKDFYDEMSDGQLSFEWIYYPEIVYVPFTFNANITNLNPNYMDYINDHIQTVIDVVEGDFDLTDVDFISFFWPFGIPSYMGDGVAEQLTERMNTKRGNIYNYILQRVVEDRNRMAYVVTHEIAHNLGLTDIYIFTWSKDHMGKSQTYAYWDLMSDPNELKAWHRWILGWMPDEQVHCLPLSTNEEHRVFLEPLNHTEADTRQIVVSLSETEAISIELRGPGRFCNSGCNQNVLVTYNNTLSANGSGPMEILRPARSKNPRFMDSLLLQGESVQFRNVTITHSERYQLGSYITIRFD